MRNLRNTKRAKIKFDEAGLAKLTATAWDASNDSVILAFGPAEEDAAVTLKRLSQDSKDCDDATPIASWDAPSPTPALAVDRIIDLHCFPDSRTITLILEGGDIVVVREHPNPGEDLIEIVGSIDEGISAASWSPDEELLSIASKTGTLLLMTRDFETTAILTLSPDDVKVSAHVSVGWGKTETQFKGRGAAKVLRDPTVPEHVDEGTLSSFDDGRINISWRADGQYVAINTILEAERKRRVIRVYSREGVLESVSEPIDGLEGALSWKPSGQLIAGIQRYGDKTNVVFFERNGLRHGEFSLQFSSSDLHATGPDISLNWNLDSTVLAVSTDSIVQLWTVSNYHYYLKQEIRLQESSSSVWTLWHPERPLHLLCANAYDFRNLAYRFDICRGSVVPPYDFGVVAVIDGMTLRVTPLRVANVPPPMALHEISLPQNALDVAINGTNTEIAVLHHDSVSVWSCDYSSKSLKIPELKSTIALAEMKESLNLYGKSLGTSGFVKIQQAQHAILRTDYDRILYCEVSDDSTKNHDNELERLCNGTPQQEGAHWRSQSGYDINVHLTESGVLQISSSRQPNLSIRDCTSFIMTASHLIYTSGQHLLKFVHLNENELEIPLDEPEKDERCRRIERGAKIVTVMPTSYSLVLQMPRGNLETIYPRALVLAGIRESLREKNYKKALLSCRTHRVDMNILCDYLPEQFMSSVDSFVKQIRDTELLDLFLSSLSEEDVSKSIYRDTLSSAEEHGVNGDTSQQMAFSTTSKVNKICDAVLHVLHKQLPRRLQNIVTAHVCKSPPDLEAGLKLVSNLNSKQNKSNLEEAVEHICFLTDVNQLYDTALGIYDLEVALLVAQQSQKDPREYLPYLQGLHEMEPSKRQFSIDDDLKRRSKAISHLYALEDFERLKIYMEKYELYSTAINLYRYDKVRLAELMRLYADFLSNGNRFEEAGVAYEYVADYSSACKAYRAANMWQESLANAMLVPVSPEEVSSLADDLANALEEVKDFKSAATIRMDHLGDVEGAAKLLCKGFDFAEAMRKVILRQRPDLLTKVVDAGLIDASSSMLETLADMKSQMAAQVSRLRELREKKSENPTAFLDGADGDDGDIPDNISLAPTDASTSGSTFMTRYTNRSVGTLATNATRKTSKNRRREERKRARGKKGTVYEEEYLMNSVTRLVERLNEIGEDIDKLVQGMMRRAMRERALAIQTAAEEVRSICKESMDEVFASHGEIGFGGSHENASSGTTSRPWDGEGVLWDAEQVLSSPRKTAPIIKGFKGLSLLDS